MEEPAQDAAQDSGPDARRLIMEIAGLEHRLEDATTGETFTVKVDRPVEIEEKSFVSLLGPSGCGKTTLLTILGLLRCPTSPPDLDRFLLRVPVGETDEWTEHDLKQIWTNRRRRRVETLRRQALGFALQNGELLSSLTVRENISVPLRLNGLSRLQADERADELLQSFQLTSTALQDGDGDGRTLAEQRINRLSGGEYQRVSLARAMAHRPTLIFVDEPTSALNRELAFGALKQLRHLQCSSSSRGAAMMITHDEELARVFSDKIIRMAPRSDAPVGEVVEIETNQPREDVTDSVADQ